MKHKFLLILAIVALAAFLYPPAPGLALPILGTATDFAVLGHTGITNTGPTVVFGSASTLANVGNYQVGANAISGFDTALNTFYGTGSFTDGPGLVNAPAAIHGGDAVADVARNDFWTAYNALLSYGTATNMTGEDLGDYNSGNLGALAAGIYSFDTSVGVTGTLELDAQNTNGGYWVFQIGTTLTTASASAVQLINAGSNNGSDVGVFWLVGSSATLGTTTAFEGNILAAESIDMLDSATIYNGRAFAYNGAVTLHNNVISNICPSALEDVTGGPGSSSPNSGPGFSGGLAFDENGAVVETGPGTSVPEPATMLLLGSGLAGLAAFRKRFKKA